MLYSNGVVFKKLFNESGKSGAGARKTTPLFLNSRTTSLSLGISSRQGPQPINHIFSTTTFPRKDLRSKVFPSSEETLNCGAGSFQPSIAFLAALLLPSKYSSKP